MRVVVFGGTGTVGSQVVAGLLAKGSFLEIADGRNFEVRVATRSPERVRTVSKKLTAVKADMHQQETVDAAVKGADAVFLLTALSRTELEEGTSVIEAMKKNGVKRVVFLSIHNVHSAPHVPHFQTKIQLEKKIKDAGFTYTILEANNFYQNDVWYAQSIMGYGVYPQPIGRIGINRVDVRDIADAAVNAFTESGHENQHYPLVGPDAWTGESTTKVLSKILRKKLRYGGDELGPWAKQSKEYLPEWLVEDLLIMYDFFQKNGLLATPEDFERQAKILGHPPRKYEDYAKEFAYSLEANAGEVA